MTFEELEAEALEFLGVPLRDVLNTHDHYIVWSKAQKPRGTDQDKWAEYKRHPHGMAQQPPYLDLWHWLLEKSESTPWVDLRSRRYKDFVITERNLDREWVRAIMAPLLARHGGKIELHLSVDT